jgi:hypothetical protein
MNPESVFRFLLALALLPIVLSIGRNIRMPAAGRRAFVVGICAIVLAFGMQAVGPLVPWTGLRFVRHATFGIGGFGLAWAAWKARVHELAAVGGGVA